MRGRLFRFGLPLLLVVVSGAGAAMAATSQSHATRATVTTMKSSSFGTILVAANGHTLYRYTIDRKGVNRCSSDATCNKFWPALLVKAGTKPNAGSGVQAALLGTIKARGGMHQVTYAGFPLYFFSGDTKAGQTKGQGFESKWYVVNTKGAMVRHEAMSPGPAPAPTPTPPTPGGGGTWG